MAYLEAAVVVYLQRALNITPDRLFPLRGPEDGRPTWPPSRSAGEFACDLVNA